MVWVNFGDLVIQQHPKRIIYLERVYHYLHLLRVSQWSKSVFVLLGVFYAQARGYLIPALLAALAFSFISSAVYIYNDMEDLPEDKLHPHKSKRPLSAGKVSATEATLLLFTLLVFGLALGWAVSRHLALILCCYLLINLAYNNLLKFIPIVDVLCIAAGFMLRILAGTIGIGLPISPWLAVAATLLSLFIALNKRRLEMHLGLSQGARIVLKKYQPQLLHYVTIAIGFACFATYFFYTVFAHVQSFYFLLTLPFAAIALWRFDFLASQDVDNDDPLYVFVHDRLSRFNFYCFLILTVMALTKS